MPSYSDLLKSMKANKKKIGGISWFSSSKYKAVIKSLEEINKMSDQPVTEESVKQMEKLHAQLGAACDKYLQDRGKTKSDAGKDRFSLIQQISDLQKTENPSNLRERSAYESAHGKTWSQVTSEMRIASADMRNQPHNYVGAGVSRRLAVNAGGMNGFFTETTTPTGPTDLSFDEIVEMQLAKVPDASRDFIRQKRAEFNASVCDTTLNFLDTHSDFDISKHPYSAELNKQLDGLIPISFKNEQDFEAALMFCKAVGKVQLGIGAQRAAGIEVGSDMSRRNEATSRMASLLGVSGLIAKSKQARIIDADGIHNGIIMEKAEGLDYASTKPQDVAVKKGFTSVSSGTLQRDCANMFVLDLVCGQLDRHAGNRFVKFAPDANGVMQPVGLQGIDNDLAFGTISGLERLSTGEFMSKLPDLSSLKVVDTDMVAHVNAISDEIIDYSFSDLLKPEEVSALKTRFAAVRKQFEQCHWIDGAEWGEKTQQEMASNGYFTDYLDQSQMNCEKLEQQRQEQQSRDTIIEGRRDRSPSVSEKAQPAVAPETRKRATSFTEEFRKKVSGDNPKTTTADPKSGIAKGKDSPDLGSKKQ